MDILEFTDDLWLEIAPAFTWVSEKLGDIVSPLMYLGPTVGIFCLAVLTYGLIKLLSHFYTPQTEQKLQKEFKQLQEMRNEAKQNGARETVKGFDEQMDRIYFEHLRASVLRGAAVHAIPILSMLCWVWSYYTPEKLKAMFANPYVIDLPFKVGKYEFIGAAPWFILSLIIVWIVHVVFNSLFLRRKMKKDQKGVDLSTQEAM